MDMSLEKVAQNIKNDFNWPKKGTLLLAVSGGPDSTLMTLVMKKVSQQFGFDIHIVHIDHNLRGENSLNDSRFVRHLAKENDIVCTVKRIDIPSIMKTETGSTQEVCRKYRIDYIKSLAKKINAFGIAYGHNKNDQAETLLMNLIRGSGTNGLTGMDNYSTENDVLIVRPLIRLFREEIIELLNQSSQNYRLDESNLKDDYTRNHIRHNLIPFIENNYNNNFINALSRTSEIITIDNDYLEKTVKKYFEKYFHVDTGAIYVNINDIDKLHLSIKLRLFRLAYKTLVGSLEELTYRHSLDMISSLEGKHNYSVNLPSEISVLRMYNKVFIHKKNYFKNEELTQKMVELDKEISFGKTRLKFYMADLWDGIEHNQYLFDYDKLSIPIYIRSRKPGDRIKPFGMDGTKKVKDVMIDMKVLRHLRKRIPLLIDSNNEVLAIINLKRSNHALLENETKNILVCEILEVPQWTKI